LSCGQDAAIELVTWQQAIAHAHAVGDLAGPDPQGRFPEPGKKLGGRNPFADVGKRRTFVDETIGELEIRAMPGQPPCATCSTPLAVESQSDGMLVMRCPGCGAKHTYEAPFDAIEAMPALRGIVADEHVRGLRDVALEDTIEGEKLAFCPKCQADVPIHGRSTIVDCPSCATRSRVTNEML